MNKNIIIILMIISILIILSGCIDSVPAKSEQFMSLLRTSDPFQNSFNTIYLVHDDKLNVTCWILAGSGISCIPDSQLNMSK